MSLWHRLTSGLDPSDRDVSAAHSPVVDQDDETQVLEPTDADQADGAGPDDDLGEEDLLAEIADAQADLADRVDRLLDEVGKLGREQFRATTLLEGHDTVLEELAEGWREEQERREAVAAQERVTRSEIEAQARLAMAKELLPIADALDASTRAAHELVAALRVVQPSPGATPPASRPWWRAWLPVKSVTVRPARPTGDGASALESWLRGLLLIEERLRALLDREGVRPMRALGERFDPHRHLAVAVSDAHAVPDGTIVAEDLRGYTIGDRVLRHAEVVVARAAGARSSPGTDGE